MQRQEQFTSNIESAAKVLREEVLKLVPVETRIDMFEKNLQGQIVVDVFRGNKTHANMLAKELMVIRRVSKLVADLKMIFETLIVRIGTLHDYNEFCSVVNPAVASLKEVRQDLVKIVPAARAVFTDMSMIPHTLQTLDVKHGVSASTVTNDALQILEEATNIVEERLRRKLPTLPEIKPEGRVLVDA